MRRITGGLFQSVDGVVQAPGGPEEDPTGGFALGGWVAPHFDEALGEFMAGEIDKAEYDLLLGRRTYEIFASYWPYQADEVGAKFDRIRKYVVTSHALEPVWRNSEALVGDPVATVGALRAGDGPDLLIQGSSRLYPALLGAGLINRLFLITLPVLLGPGKHAFDGASAPAGLTLTDHRVTGAGVVVAVYEAAGEVRTGSFETQPPSADELARRARWAAEDGAKSSG